MPHSCPRVRTPGCSGQRGQPRGCIQVPPHRPIRGMVVFPGLCPDLTCLFLPQASACWPSAMRCSLKRSLTAALAASFVLLLLLLRGGSWQEQDPLQVSPPPVMSHWRGHWSILHPCLTHMDPNPSSAPFPAPYHPQTAALPSPLPGLTLCTWASPDPGAGRGRTGAPLHFWVHLLSFPLAHGCPWCPGV